MIKKKCPVCGENYETYPSQNVKTCSSECGCKLRRINTYKKNKKKCTHCKKEFLPKHNKCFQYCSKKCRGLSLRKDVYRQGYLYRTVENHPNRNKSNRVPVHTLVYEEYHKIILGSYFVVHHINGIRDDNRIENLKLMTDKQHKIFHAKNRNRNKKGVYK